jgi:formate-dependent nitrite reductase cytochrome c552 subunit
LQSWKKWEQCNNNQSKYYFSNKPQKQTNAVEFVWKNAVSLTKPNDYYRAIALTKPNDYYKTIALIKPNVIIKQLL